MRFGGYYYSGKESARREVRAEFSGGMIILSDGEGEWSYPLADTDVRRGIGSSPGFLNFPDGSSLETKDSDALTQMLNEHGRGGRETFVLLLEKRWRYVFSALLFTVLTALLLFFYGVPLISKAAAFSLPAETNSLIGQNTLSLLDRHLFAESRLPEGKKAELRGLFESLRRGLPDGFKYNLVFRGGGRMGANAMALPDGTVIVTDELVNLSDNDYETASVLAHELGHVVNRHGIRTLFQSSILSAAVIAVTGDVSSLTVGIPTFLLESKYSREFEEEADAFAVKLMKEHGISPEYFAVMLKKLGGEHDEKTGKLLNYVSTHPMTAERVKNIMKAAEGGK